MSADIEHPDGELDGVSDPSDFKQKRRIKAILDARERVAEQSRKALDMQAKGQVDETLARRMVRQAVKEYALESEHSIRKHLPSGGEPREWSAEEEAAYHTWKEADLGELEMRTDVKRFEGVESFIEAPRRIEEQWVESAANPVEGSDNVVYSDTHEIPLEVSERAYRALNYWWHEVGLGVEMDEKLPTDMI